MHGIPSCLISSGMDHSRTSDTASARDAIPNHRRLGGQVCLSLIRLCMLYYWLLITMSNSEVDMNRTDDKQR